MAAFLSSQTASPAVYGEQLKAIFISDDSEYSDNSDNSHDQILCCDDDEEVEPCTPDTSNTHNGDVWPVHGKAEDDACSHQAPVDDIYTTKSVNSQDHSSMSEDK